MYCGWELQKYSVTDLSQELKFPEFTYIKASFPEWHGLLTLSDSDFRFGKSSWGIEARNSRYSGVQLVSLRETSVRPRWSRTPLDQHGFFLINQARRWSTNNQHSSIQSFIWVIRNIGSLTGQSHERRQNLRCLANLNIWEKRVLALPLCSNSMSCGFTLLSKLVCIRCNHLPLYKYIFPAWCLEDLSDHELGFLQLIAHWIIWKINRTFDARLSADQACWIRLCII